MSFTSPKYSRRRTAPAFSSPKRLEPSSVRSPSFVLTEAALSRQELRHSRVEKIKRSWRVRNCFTEWRRLVWTSRFGFASKSAWTDRRSMSLLGIPNSKSKVLALGNSTSPTAKSMASLSESDLILELQSSMMDREDVIRSLLHPWTTCEHDCDFFVHEVKKKTETASQQTLVDRTQGVRWSAQEETCVFEQLHHEHKKQLKSLDAEWNARLQQSLDENRCLQQDHARQILQLRKEMGYCLQECPDEHSVRLRKLDAHFDLLNTESTVAAGKLGLEYESHIVQLEPQWQERLAEFHSRSATLQEELNSHCTLLEAKAAAQENVSRKQASMNVQRITDQEELAKVKQELKRLQVESSVAVEEKDQHLIAARGEMTYLQTELQHMRFVVDQHSAYETVANDEISNLKASLEKMQVAAQENISRSQVSMKDEQITDQEEPARLKQELERLQVESSVAMEDKDQHLLAAHGEVAYLKEEMRQMRRAADQHSANETVANNEIANLKASLAEMKVAAQQVLSFGVEQMDQPLSVAQCEVASVNQAMEQMMLVVEQPSASLSVDLSTYTHDMVPSPGAMGCTNPMINLDPPIVQCGSCGLDTEFDPEVWDTSDTRSESSMLSEKDCKSLSEDLVVFEVVLYQIIRAVIVKESPETDSKQVAELFPNKFVHVLEVKDFEDRVRARIAEPPGWISIVNKSKGLQYATHVTMSSSLDGPPMQSAIPSMVEQKSARVLRRSLECLPVIDEEQIVETREEENETVDH